MYMVVGKETFLYFQKITIFLAYANLHVWIGLR
jgi:hypothetical protein